MADHLALSKLKQGLGGFRCRLTIGRRSRAGAGGTAGGVGLLSEAGVSRLGDALLLGPVVILEGVPLGAADFAAHFQQLVGDLFHKAGRQVGRGPAEEHSLGGAGEVEAFLRAGQSDVAQAALLLQLVLLPNGPVAGEDALFHAHGEHHGELQALGGVHGHEGHAVVVFLHAVQIGVEGHFVQEAAERGVLCVFQIAADGRGQFVDVFQARLALVVFLRREHLGVAALLDQGLVDLRQLHFLGQALEMLDEVGELLELRRSFFQLRDLRRVDQDFPEGLSRLGRQGSGRFHGLGPDAAGRVVDHPQQAQVVAGVVDDAEVRQHVFDLRPLEEAEAAHHAVGDAVALEGHFHLVGEGVHAVEHRAVPPLPPLAIGFQELGGDVHALFPLVPGGVEADLFPLAVVGPEVLALAPPVVADDGIGGLQDVAGGAVVLLQADDAGVFVLALKGKDILNGGAPEAVDGLVVVAHHADVFAFPGQQSGQEILQVVRILVLVNEDIMKFPLVILPHLRELLQEPDGM